MNMAKRPPPLLVHGKGPDALESVAVGDQTPGAYQWWYFDAVSDNSEWSMVAIYFVGGVFSPLYADRIAAGVAASPCDHPMVHLVVYRGGRRVLWVLSEYPRSCLEVADRDLDLRIGASTLSRLPGHLYLATIADDDFPRGRSVRAGFTFASEQDALAPSGFALSPDGRHLWAAPVPRCRMVFRCESHGIAFSGSGYHDVNAGSEPLHEGWQEWCWERAHLPAETRILYDARHSSGDRISLRLSSDQNAQFDESDPFARRVWTPWLLAPPNSGTARGKPSIVLESSPFYERRMAVIPSGAHVGHRVSEYLDLRRFSREIVRYMLRYRTYRRPGPAAPPLPRQVHRREVFPDDPV